MTIANGSLPDADDVQLMRNMMINQLRSLREGLRADNKYAYDNVFWNGCYDCQMTEVESATNFSDFGAATYHQAGTYFLDSVGNSGTITSKPFFKTKTITKGSVFCLYKVVDILDDFEDSSISGDWTTSTGGTGTIVEANHYLRMLCGVGAGANSVYALYDGEDFRLSNKVVHILASVHGPTNGSSTLYVSNGTNNVLIKNWAAGVDSDNALITLRFMGADDKVRLYINGVYDSEIDVSASTTNQYIKFATVGTNTSNEGWYISLLSKESESWDSTVTSTVQLDGSNAETVGVNTSDSHTFSNTGDTPEIVLSFTRATGEAIMVFGYSFIWV